ncbi:MAG: Usg family protein [Alphaproteobacteria bacterium]|nr:Usg family protein [Alphaproteobacteria bacterium]
MNARLSDLEKQLLGYRLTTAQILYHMPDTPSLLQEFIWQNYDLAPKFPKLYKFLDFWEHKIDGSLHSVYVAKKEIISPNDTRFCDAEFTLQ